MADLAAGGLDVLGGAEAYEDIQIGREAERSRSESRERILTLQQKAAEGRRDEDINQRGLEGKATAIQLEGLEGERQRTGLRRDELEIDRGRLGLRSESVELGRGETALSRRGLEGEERRLDIQEGALGAQRESVSEAARIQKGLIASDVRVAEIQRLGQEAQRAFASKDLKLGMAAATQKARIESSRAKMLHAKGGASAFTKAYSSMSTNALSSFEQKQTALKLEGIISDTVFNERMAQSGLRGEEVDRQLLAAMDDIDKQVALIGEARTDIDLAGERLDIKDDRSDLEQQGIDFDFESIELQEEGLDIDLRDIDLQEAQIGVETGMRESEYRQEDIDYYTSQDIYTEQRQEEQRQQDYLDEQMEDGVYGTLVDSINTIASGEYTSNEWEVGIHDYD